LPIGKDSPRIYGSRSCYAQRPECLWLIVHTLALTDVASRWTKCLALPVREQSLIVEATTAVSARLPFPLLGLDTDNDSAFMNDALWDYCQQKGFEFTRCRAYRKNAQAWVEQKNGASSLFFREILSDFSHYLLDILVEWVPQPVYSSTRTPSKAWYHGYRRRLKRGAGQASALSPAPRKTSSYERRWKDDVIAHRFARATVGYHFQRPRLKRGMSRRALYRLLMPERERSLHQRLNARLQRNSLNKKALISLDQGMRVARSVLRFTF
jgi:hypothetical protein